MNTFLHVFFWAVVGVVSVCALVFGALVLMANMMSDRGR